MGKIDYIPSAHNNPNNPNVPNNPIIIMKPKVYIIGAADQKNGIGIKNTLPWKLAEDMAFFQKTTMKTDDSNRRNMVIIKPRTA